MEIRETIIIEVLRANTYMHQDFAAEVATKITEALTAAEIINPTQAPTA